MASTAPSIQPATRPYRDFVTPILHKRFTKAAAYTFLICWFIAAWQGTWSNCRWSLELQDNPANTICICRLLVSFLAP